MRTAFVRIVAVGAIAALVLAAFAAALAQTGYELDWWTVDGGGGASGDAALVVNGTAGQPDAGASGGGDYTLSGGFWGGGLPTLSFRLYLPAAARNAGAPARVGAVSGTLP